MASHHFMANRWGNNGNSEKLHFWGLQNHCRWWLQPWNEKMLAPWKKSYDQPWQHVKKQRHYFADKGLVKAMVFPLVMYGYESWTARKAEHQKINAFELWCWRRLLRVPWTARRSSQSILPSVLSIWKDWCCSWNSNTLATWCKELTHWKRPWCRKDWRRKEKGMTQDEMVGWHLQLDGYEFE